MLSYTFLPVKKNIVVKGVDEEIYRKVKAKASLLGIRVSDAVNMALKAWVEDFFDEQEENRRVARAFIEKNKHLKGKYLVVAKGKVMGVYDTLDEAIVVLRKLWNEGVRKAILTEIGEEKEVLEWGGGSFELISD